MDGITVHCMYSLVHVLPVRPCNLLASSAAGLSCLSSVQLVLTCIQFSVPTSMRAGTVAPPVRMLTGEDRAATAMCGRRLRQRERRRRQQLLALHPSTRDISTATSSPCIFNSLFFNVMRRHFKWLARQCMQERMEGVVHYPRGCQLQLQLHGQAAACTVGYIDCPTLHPAAQ